MKRWLIPALIGWGIAAFFGPRELVAIVRRK